MVGSGEPEPVTGQWRPATERKPPRHPPLRGKPRRYGRRTAALYVVATVPMVGMFDAALRAVTGVVLTIHPWTHQPGRNGVSSSPKQPVVEVLRRLSTTTHLVWGRVVPDIPAFCRELVAALAEQ